MSSLSSQKDAWSSDGMSVINQYCKILHLKVHVVNLSNWKGYNV